MTASLPCDSYYVLDAEDRIVEFGGRDWDGFARNNGETRLAVEDISGDLIYEYVAGHFTQRFLRAFFAQARAAAPASLSRTYRCDSPAMKRLMEMRACAIPGEALRVEHRLFSETPMATPAAFQESGAAKAAGRLRCSMCNRIRNGPLLDWREPDETPMPGPITAVVHTVCLDCRRGVGAKIPLRPAIGG